MISILPAIELVIALTNDIVEDTHFVTVSFLCERFKGEPMSREPDEITQWKWFALNDLPSPIYFLSGQILNNYLDEEIYKK